MNVQNQKNNNNIKIEIFWDDLTTDAQNELSRLLGDNNYDVLPIATIECEPLG